MTVTATGPGKTYGTALTAGPSSANFTATGMQNSETVASVTLTPNAAGLSATTAAGASYVVAPSAATGTINTANYNITYNAYNGTVGTAALSITASGQSKAYGQTVNFGSGSTLFTSSGLQNNETIGTVTLACSGGAQAAAVSGSPYPITPSAATGGTFTPANYNITYNNGALTVNRAILTVTADNKIMGYGQAVPALTYTINGFVNGENSSVVGGAPNLSTTAGPGSPTGTYPITVTQGTLSAANYTFAPQNGTLTVQSVVTITATQPTASEVGLVPGTFTVTRTDTGAALTNNYTIGGTAIGGTDYQALSGSVTINQGALSAPLIYVTPIQNADTGVGSSTVVLSLQSSTNYMLGTTITATCTIIDAYGDTDSDGLADAMEAALGCNPQVFNPGWKLDSDNDGLPDTYETMAGSGALGLPAYSKNPTR